MNSDSLPKLPTWLFITTDLALIGVAALIGYNTRGHPSPGQLVTIVVCVGLGAIVGLAPLVAYYERQKNAALDERQRELEALGRTVTSSAEQISIAAAGLHQIAELAQKNLRTAEQLPHKLQEKIAEFQAQLAQVADADKEELERELLALRTTESERLESVSQRIAKSAAEWAKLEAATQQQLAAANEALAKLSLGTAAAIGKAQAAAEQALTHARTEAARGIGEASGAATRAIDQAKFAALNEFATRIAAAAEAAAQRIAKELDTPVASAARRSREELRPLDTAAAADSAAFATPASTVKAPPAEPVAAPTEAPSVSNSATTPPAVVTEHAGTGTAPAPATEASPPPSTSTPGTAIPAKRSRKARREESDAPDARAVAATAEAVPSEPADRVTPALDASRESASAASPAATSGPAEAGPTAPPASEPAPIPASSFSEITPVAPQTNEPFPASTETHANGTSPTEPPADTAREAKAMRKIRPARSVAEPNPEPELGLDLDVASSAPRPGVFDRVATPDGATRLLVTAYIGIGNRLFIRGNGAGLSWEKGIPLQFISIGKWRWETNDASAPVQFKLYKNDEVECSALGEQTLDPAHQQEVTAVF